MIDKKRTAYISRDNLSTLASWDGIERRLQERRGVVSLSTQLVDNDQSPEKKVPLIVKYAPVISAFLAIATTLGSFGATLYTRITKLESNQVTTVDKIEIIKHDIEDVKALLKEGDKSRVQLKNQIDSLEESFIQLYSAKSKK
jgi:hypothetical protein